MKRVLFIIVMSISGVIVFSGLSWAEPFVSIYLGAVIPHESDAEDNTGIGGSGTVEFDAGAGFGGKAGYWFDEQNAPYLGVELDLGAAFFKVDKFNFFGIGVDADADVTGLSATVNGLVRYPEGPIRPYGGVGIGLFYADVDNGTILGIPFEGDDDSAFGWQLLGGIDWLIATNISVFVEYKYTRADFEFEKGIGLDIDYEASQVYGGVSYHF